MKKSELLNNNSNYVFDCLNSLFACINSTFARWTPACTPALIRTLPTNSVNISDGVEKLLSPFKKIGLPAHEIAMMMMIALRFIPTLMEESDKIIKAQKARGADFENGFVIARAKALVPIVIQIGRAHV